MLLTDRAGTIVGAAHAGWRGLAAGVIENTVGAMTPHGAAAGDLIAYIGPGIGPQAFEVGDDVYQAYVSHDTAAAAAFTRTGHDKWLANLFLLARARSSARASRECMAKIFAPIPTRSVFFPIDATKSPVAWARSSGGYNPALPFERPAA